MDGLAVLFKKQELLLFRYAPHIRMVRGGILGMGRIHGGSLPINMSLAHRGWPQALVTVSCGKLRQEYDHYSGASSPYVARRMREQPMCGRFNVSDDPLVQGLMEELGLPGLYPRPQRNVPPGGTADFVLENGGKRHLIPGIWSLLIEEKPDHSGYRPNPKFNTFNAKSTRLNESKLWKRAFASQRCIVPVSAFHEWQGKQVYNIHPEGEATALAGLWQSYQFGDELVHAFTVITLPPHPRFEHIHPKSLPLMLRPGDFDLWLDPDFRNVDAFQGLLRTHIPAPLVCEPVRGPTDLTPVGEPEVLAAD